MPITFIGLDADDTLWHNETVFRSTQARLVELLRPFADPAAIEAELARVEHRNIEVYGYGVKGFILSMLELAIDVSGGRIGADVLGRILEIGRDMMRHPIELLPGVKDALPRLAEQGRLVLITKGDLFHQEAKLAASGLGHVFSGVEIVSAKTPDVYGRIFARHGVRPDEAVMAGNSVKSDILPVLALGGYAALVPYPLIWAHEAADAPRHHPGFRELASLDDLPGWIAEIA